MNMSQWKPMRGKILARPIQRTPPPGLVLPDQEEGSELVCEVIAIGDPVIRRPDEGEPFEIPWDFKVGDKVMREKYAGDRLFDDNLVRHVILDADEIMGVVED